MARLRQDPGDDVVSLGGAELVRSLVRRDLIDRYLLLIHTRVCRPPRGGDRHIREGRRMKTYLLSIYPPEGEELPPPEFLAKVMSDIDRVVRERGRAELPGRRRAGLSVERGTAR